MIRLIETVKFFLNCSEIKLLMNPQAKQTFSYSHKHRSRARSPPVNLAHNPHLIKLQIRSYLKYGKAHYWSFQFKICDFQTNLHLIEYCTEVILKCFVKYATNVQEMFYNVQSY